MPRAPRTQSLAILCKEAMEPGKDGDFKWIHCQITEPGTGDLHYEYYFNLFSPGGRALMARSAWRANMSDLVLTSWSEEPPHDWQNQPWR